MAHAAYDTCTRAFACTVVVVVDVFTGRTNILFCGLLFTLDGAR